MIGVSPKDAEHRLAELIAQLYQINPVGGPLHVVLDDGNVDGWIEPYYSGWPDDELDALWYEGTPIAELDPEAPAVVEGLGMSVRQLCNEIALILNGMPIERRETMYERTPSWTAEG